MFGKGWAKIITDSHEMYLGEDIDNDTKVDLINNWEGFKYAEENEVNMFEVLETDQSTADFLNEMTVYVLSQNENYANDPNFQEIISGETLLFNADQEGVKAFRENMLITIALSMKYVILPEE